MSGQAPLFVALPVAVGLLAAGPMAPSEAGAEHGSHLLWVVGWLLLLMGCVGVSVWRKRDFEFRFTRSDLILVAGCVVMAIAAVRGGTQANLRAGWNMGWYWVGVAVCLVALRQLFVPQISSHVRRIVTMVMIGLAGGLATHGIVQFAVTMPALVTQYEASSEAERIEQLMAMGVDPEPGSASRIQFENRLRSTEPYATFALGNSLAGVLAPWLLVTVALLLLPNRSRSFTVPVVVLAIVLSACVVLTKSRAAVLAVAAGGAVLVMLDLLGARRMGWKLPLGATLFAAVAVGVGIAVGALDREVLTQAAMSFRYRMEYWQATLSMVSDHWLLGCGSGNFQDYYGQYQLPHASELVADPHNFVLELGATGGVFAMLLFVAGWSFAIYDSWRSGSESVEPQKSDTAQDGATEIPWVWAGAGLGLVGGWAASLGLGFSQEFVGVLPLAMVAGGVGLWIARWAWANGLDATSVNSNKGRPTPNDRSMDGSRDGSDGDSLLRMVMPIALLTALINLLVAGGVSHWGVMQSILVMGVLLPADHRSLLLSPSRASFVLLALIGVMLALQFTALRPVVGAQHAIATAESASSSAAAIDQLQAAAAADPWSAEPPQMLAQSRAAMGKWDDTTWTLFADAISRDKRNANLWTDLGKWKLIGSEFGRDEQRWKEAVDAFRRVVELAPRGTSHAKLAWALSFGGEDAQREARQWAAIALDWSDSHPHAEQRLDRLSLPARGGTVNAEQVMRKLRSSGKP